MRRLNGEMFTRTGYWDAPRMGQGRRCWQTDDGGTWCDDNSYHPPGCPSAPAVTEVGVILRPEDATVMPGCPVAAAGVGFPVVPVAIGAAALLAAAWFFSK